MTQWNPYYVAYARVHGRDPEAQKAYDRERWPGGYCCGFMVWMSNRWQEFEFIKRGLVTSDYHFSRSLWRLNNETEFGAWLAALPVGHDPVSNEDNNYRWPAPWRTKEKARATP